MRSLKSHRQQPPAPPARQAGQVGDPAVAPEGSGDRIVFWKAKELVDEEDYGPVWIADASDHNLTLEEPGLWLSWAEAEEFAQKRGLPLEDVEIFPIRSYM